jgi:hypothetical protein
VGGVTVESRTEHFDLTVARIQAMCDEWEPYFDLPGINVEHRFLDTRLDEELLTAADTEVKWQYRWAVIRWYVPAVVGVPDEELRGIVVHEYAHVLLGPIVDRLRSGSDELNELATENVARALLSFDG